MNTFELERSIIKANKKKLIKIFMGLGLIKKNKTCENCLNECKYVKYKRNIDGFAWRCMQKTCKAYKKYLSLRIGSFFNGFNISLREILLVIIKYIKKSPRHAIIKSLNLDAKTIRKTLKKPISLIPKNNFNENKLGGPGFTVQIDETMLNFKCKSHRGRSPTNSTDALCE